MSKIKAFWEWVKNNKHKVIFSIFIVIIAFYPYSKGGDDKHSKSDPSPTPISISRENFSFDSNNIPKYTDKTEVYLLNNFETPNIVNGFSWDKNKIIYTSNSGVFDLGGNEKIFESQIQQSFFDTKGTKLLIVQSNNISIIDLKDNSKNKIDISATKGSIKVDGNLNYILYINSTDNLIHLYDTNTKLDKTVIGSGSNFEFNWIFKQNKFYIYDINLNETAIYDTELQKIGVFKINTGKLLSINSDINRIITIDETSLYVSDTTNSILFKNKFNNTQDLSIFWINKDIFVAIEKVDLGYLDLYDQFLWVIDIKGRIKYLSNSEPVTTKLNTKIIPKVNEEQSAFIITDNRSQIWVYSLKPGYIPTYTNEGIYLYKVPDVSREDSH